MKKLFTIFCLSLTITVSSQQYQLFDVNSKKVFKTLEALAETYNLVFDSAVNYSDDIILYPYRNIDSQETPPTLCQPWGSGCFARTTPTWIGEAVVQKANGDYIFVTHLDDSLSFDFTLAPLQAHSFFQDSQQRFTISLSAIPLDTVHYGDLIDTVRRYQISHTDLQGNIINSALNNYEIVIGKELGLINFFVIDSFPQVLIPLELLGNENPPAGLFHLTNAMVFDHQPGDEIQYYEYYFHLSSPEFSYRRYSKHTFLERNETADSIAYLIRVESFKVDSLDVTIDTILMRYMKEQQIADIPYDFPYEDYKLNSQLHFENHIDEIHWEFQVHNNTAFEFCEVDNLWCGVSFDGFESSKYVQGLGLYKHSWESIHYYPYYGHRVVYYKKDGIEHGSELIVGIKDAQGGNPIRVIPNPVTDEFRVDGKFSGSAYVMINDLNGRNILTVLNYISNQMVDVSSLESGLYLISVIDEEKVYSGKLIIR